MGLIIAMTQRKKSRKDVAGYFAPPAKPTPFGAFVVATLVTTPLAIGVLIIEVVMM